MDQRIIYENDEGGVAIVVPAPGTGITIEQLATQVVPSGRTYQIVDVSEIPTDRTFRNAWTLGE